MFRKFIKFLILLLLCLFNKISYCQQIDLNICPDGLTNWSTGLLRSKLSSNHFEIHAELTTDIETFEITQLFSSPSQDVIFFRDYQTNIQTYYNFHLNEILTINEDLICQRTEIGTNEYLPFITSEFVKPSILFGYDGRNNLIEKFYTQYIGREIIHNGILTDKYQSCFFLEQQNLTINATYYLSILSDNELYLNSLADIIQIDVHSNNYPYTYNIIHYKSNPSLTISTPENVYCQNRINTKEFPDNLPNHISLHMESYTPKNNFLPSKIDSYNRLIDESLEFEQIDYGMSNMLKSSQLLIDYSTNLTYLYVSETQQCVEMNSSIHSMGTINDILFHFGSQHDSIDFQYTGFSQCGREYVQCHRWIGRRDLEKFIQQYEWYWAEQYNQMDLNELIPMKVNIKIIFKNESEKIINQEIHIFNYDPLPNSIETIDSTLSDCYRALGPTHHYNYAVLGLILNNDDKYPIHRYLLSIKNDLHLQLATNLQIRPIRLGNLIIDLINHDNKDIYITFTLLDNPPRLSYTYNEPSLFDLIIQLEKEINHGKFHVRINDGAFDLHTREHSFRVLELSEAFPENYTNHFNDHNSTQIIIKPHDKFIYKHIDSKIIALWTSSVLIGLILTLVIGFFLTIRKWKPMVFNHRT